MAYIKLGNMGRKRPIQDEEGGSALPEVTPADEGSVLAVNSDGEWDVEDRSGKITMGEYYTLDKSYNDLLAMINAGIVPWFIEVLSEDGDTFNTIYTLALLKTESGVYNAVFNFITAADREYSSLTFTAESATEHLFVD